LLALDGPENALRVGNSTDKNPHFQDSSVQKQTGTNLATKLSPTTYKRHSRIDKTVAIMEDMRVITPLSTAIVKQMNPNKPV